MTCPAACSSLRLTLDWDMVLHRYDPGQAFSGSVVEPEELPLSPSTVEALRRWYRSFSDLYLRDGPRGEHDDVDWRLIEEEGVRLWRVLLGELGPGVRVYYYSELFHETFATPEEYERVVGDERSRATR